METLINSNQKTASFQKEQTEVKTTARTNSISKFLNEAESNRFGITPILLLIMACMGGFAAASGILDSWVKLAAVAFPATIALAMILAVAPMRAIFISAAISIILDVLVLIF